MAVLPLPLFAALLPGSGSLRPVSCVHLLTGVIFSVMIVMDHLSLLISVLASDSLSRWLLYLLVSVHHSLNACLLPVQKGVMMHLGPFSACLWGLQFLNGM